jgi:hypothetical protein
VGVVSIEDITVDYSTGPQYYHACYGIEYQGTYTCTWYVHVYVHVSVRTRILIMLCHNCTYQMVPLVPWYVHVYKYNIISKTTWNTSTQVQRGHYHGTGSGRCQHRRHHGTWYRPMYTCTIGCTIGTMVHVYVLWTLAQNCKTVPWYWLASTHVPLVLIPLVHRVRTRYHGTRVPLVRTNGTHVCMVFLLQYYNTTYHGSVSIVHVYHGTRVRTMVPLVPLVPW